MAEVGSERRREGGKGWRCAEEGKEEGWSKSYQGVASSEHGLWGHGTLGPKG